jgi:predicted protein tyrosine phosphatase
MNLLFICTYNRIRSRTAENIYKNRPGFSVRSAGISEQAAHKLSASDLEWADLVIVMEARHRDYILENFSSLSLPRIETLDYKTNLTYMHPQLIEELKEEIDGLLSN